MIDHWSGFPQSLRIGAHDLGVRIIPDWAPDGNTTDGKYSSGELLIRFSEAPVAKSAAVETAIHEICHALLARLELKEKKEELICLAIGAGMTQVLRDNPHFLSWLSDIGHGSNGNGDGICNGGYKR